MADVTLIDGREVDSQSWFVQCDQRVMADHLAAMWRLDTQGRRDYMDGVGRSQGPLWREALAMRFSRDWEARRAGK